jgi:hypothetical protein
MRMVRNGVAAMLVLVFATMLAAQAPVTAGDIDRLDATAREIDTQIRTPDRLDPTMAAEAAKTLSDLRDEVTYLRVKMRREASVSRAEYGELRDRLETLRVKVQGGTTAAAAAAVEGRVYTLPVGTEFDVRLQTPLSSRTAKPEQRFEATTLTDLMRGADVTIPAGSVARGFVSSVSQAGRIDRTGSLTLSFDELVVDQRVSRLRASVVKALEPSLSEDATRVGAAAAVGAVLGGLLGGGKGALLGVLIGGGGTIASTEGSDVDLPIGTVLRVRIDQPLDISR